MSWAADGQDGNRLHLEKMRLIVSSLSHLIFFFLAFIEQYT